ncbi:spermatogenesis-associated protein 7 [Myxocyprinus asiaticus]|uniref:spermatogenesis-associated protein 7 n=1 Tax=Myxocyprinus asiaticus TaxID=70543 RepID=UPI00222199C0|nr:spermatogenesis-associated protein 7 [Myxocyprinus asiaticus]
MDHKPGYLSGSSGKLMNQYMIKDHMVSHYRKLYSAKAAVDCSVPKSMHSNVKYVDQKRREHSRKDTRSQTGRSDSQRNSRINSRASCSSMNSRPSVQGDDSGYHYLNQSMMSSPRISTSFHSKQIVYPPQTVSTSANHPRSASELSFRSPNPQWHHTGHSCATSTGQRRYKSFQDPTQKTYSGDVLLKHAHHFTQEKPFTPRTLKSDHKSTLLQYRYYTPPKRKSEEKNSSSRIVRQETYHGSTLSKRGFSPQLDSPQPFSLDHEWSDEESDSFRHHSRINRVSPEGMRSPIMRKVTAEEEELMYLEFIADVTNEILAQSLYSDRVLKRVFERHIHMNRHRLDENKMRHLLDNLQNDLQSPSAASITSLCAKESNNPSKLALELPSVTTDGHFLLHMVFDEVKVQRDDVTPALVSTPVNSSLLESSSQTDLEEDEKLQLNVEFNHNTGSEISLNVNEHLTCAEEHPRNTEDDNELLEQIDELGKTVTESLKVSETQKNLQDVFEEEQTRGDISDDEF